MNEVRTHKGYEMPDYRVAVADGAHEIRSYAPHLVAEVTVQGDRDDAIGTGFRILAGYIFGGNAKGEKIAMTVPVAQSPADPEGRTWTIRFMLPKDRDAATMPPPKDAAVRIVRVGGDREAVLTFSGLRGSDALERKSLELRRWIKSQGEEIVAGPHFYFYDGPMTLPWNRRNEVAFTLRQRE